MSKLQWRYALGEDLERLAVLNLRLIEDEGHRAARDLEEIRERMRGWLSGDEYRVVVFSDGGELVGYSVFRKEAESVYLRQLFVTRGKRRRGVGRSMVDLLEREILPRGKRVRLSVLAGNEAGLGFWRAVGFGDYCVVMEKGGMKS